jgi:hypothetical protein
MRIKIWASVNPQFPNTGPYKSLDVVERAMPHALGEMTHYGPVITIAPLVLDEDVDQNIIVKLDPASLNSRPDESILERKPSSYDKIQLFPIYVDPFSFPEEEPPPA